MKHKNFLVLSIAVIIGFCFSSGSFAASRTTGATAKDNPHMSEEEANNIRIYRDENKAVVNISGSTNARESMFNLVPREGFGSGTIISSDGYILTNYHVIQHASSLRATIFDGSVLPAKVIGIDPANDLAVVKIDPPSSIKLTTIPYGDSSKLQVGSDVLAIGNPFGLDRTMTRGIISSLGRTLKLENGRLIKGIIQTDAAINPGNSGGPLLDSNGKLIGITTAILSRAGQSAGIGLAIPINIAKQIVPQLIAHHQVIRPDLGIQAVQVIDRGLRVTALDEKGPAAQAGLQGPKLSVYQQGPFTIQNVDVTAADIITAVDNVNVHSVDDLLSYLELKKPGQVVTLTVLRGDRTIKIAVQLTTANVI